MRAKVDHVTDCVFLPAHAITRAGYTQFLRWSGWRRKLSLRREFSPASSQHLPRCRWGGAVAVLADGLDGKIKTGDPLSSSFPIRSSVRCNALCSAGHAPRSVSAPMISRMIWLEAKTLFEEGVFTCVLAAPATLPLRQSSVCARRWIRWKD